MRWCMLLIGLWVLSPCWGQQVTFHEVFDKDEATETAVAVLVEEDGYVMCGFGATLRTEGWGTINVVRTDTLGQLIWSKQYGAPYSTLDVYSSQSIIDDSNGYMIFGSYYDTIIDNLQGLVMFIDNNGDSIWSKTYGYTDARYVIYSAVRAFDGGFLTVGVRAQPGARAGIYWLQKLDSIGNLEWDTLLVGSRGTPWSLMKNTDSTYAVGGFRFFSGRSYDPSLMKIDRLGNILWEQSYGTLNDDPCYGFANNCRNGDFLVWSCVDTVINAGDESVTYFLARVDSIGDTVWIRYYNVPFPNIHELWQARETMTGDIVVVGSKSYDVYPSSSWIELLDSAGNQIWERIYTLPPDSVDSYLFKSIYDVKRTADGGYIGAGIASVDRNPGPLYDTDTDFSLLKLDSLGIWHFPIDTSFPPPCDTINPCPEPCDTVGLAETLLESISIYPNPATDRLHINTHGAAVELRLLSVLGAELLRQSVNGQASVDVSALPTGLYVYELRAGGHVRVGKVVVQ